MSVYDAREAFPNLVASKKLANQKRTLLVVSTDDDCISRNLLHAIEHEFPGLNVLRLDSVEEAHGASVPPAALILIDMALFQALRENATALLKHHPRALIALLQLGDVASVDPSEVLSCHFVRSVLPMNLRLDVWLAAVKLILLGGEYYPFGLLKAVLALRVETRETQIVGETEEAPVPAAADHPVGSLTARELQILELVARGLQNKLIASALKLSEHTVKIHLHNIINKLGVHNRTEAASLYFDGRALLSGMSREAASRSTPGERD